MALESSTATAAVSFDRRSETALNSTIPGEPIARRLQRWLLAAAWSAQPERISRMPALATLVARDLLSGRRELPDPERTIRGPEGYAGVCRDLAPETLCAAYGRGLFPWGHVWPRMWRSPPERMVLFLAETRVERNLRRQIRNDHFRVTFDQAPLDVMIGCAAPRVGRWPLTWLTPPVMQGYLDLFDAGHMHSIEVWDKDGDLVGGLYGVASGSVFSIESQFAAKTNASKAAIVYLAAHLQHWGFALADGKSTTAHLASLGFRLIPRADFQSYLCRPAASPPPGGHWQVDERLDIGAWDASVGPVPKPTRPAARPARQPRSVHAASADAGHLG